MRLTVTPMAPTLFTSRFLLPIISPPIEDGALLVDDARILQAGPRKELSAAYPHAAMTDFGDSVLLPPMVNAHTHLELTDVAEWAKAAGETVVPRSFVDWILWLVRVRRTVDESSLSGSLAAGLHASLCAGTGAVGDIFTTLSAADAYNVSPLLGKVYAEVLGQDQAAVAGRLARISSLLPKQPAPSLEWGLSPHTPYTLTETALQQVLGFAGDNGLQNSIHLAESEEERLFLEKGTGAIAEKIYAAAQWDPAADRISGPTPVKALCQQGRLNRGDLVVHGVQVDAGDIRLLKDLCCAVVLCPRSNAALNVGQAPLGDYLQAGVPLALGTDSMASVPSLSVWEELAFAQEWFEGSADAGTWLEIATRGGAEALGLKDRMGSLSRGAEASFQVVTVPDMPVRAKLEEALCQAGAAVKVTHLYLSGQNVLPEC